MSTVAEKPAAEVKELKVIDPVILEMSSFVNGRLALKEDGTNAQEGNIILDLAAKENLTEETIKHVFDFIGRAAAATGHSVGMGSIPIYEADKEKKLEGLSVTFPITGRDKLVVQSKRHTTSFNPKDRTQTIDTFGGISAVLETNLGNRNSGYFGAVAQNVKHAAAAALRDL